MRKWLFLSIVLVLGIYGCSDSNNTTTSPGSGDGTPGDLMGTVKLMDYRYKPILDKSGVLVKCEGTSFSAITDSGGNWVIHNLPTHTYKISFSKDGFYSFTDPIYTYVAGSPVRYFPAGRNITQGTVTIGQPPRYTITLDGISMPTTSPVGQVYLHTSNDAPDSTFVGILFLAGTSPSISIEDKSSYFYSELTGDELMAAHDSTFDFSIRLDNRSLPVYQVAIGQTMYVRAYPMYSSDWQYNVHDDATEYIGYSHTGSNILSAIRTN